jgi:hypothetical protein
MQNWVSAFKLNRLSALIRDHQITCKKIGHHLFMGFSNQSPRSITKVDVVVMCSNAQPKNARWEFGGTWNKRIRQAVIHRQAICVNMQKIVGALTR